MTSLSAAQDFTTAARAKAGSGSGEESVETRISKFLIVEVRRRNIVVPYILLLGGLEGVVVVTRTHALVVCDRIVSGSHTHIHIIIFPPWVFSACHLNNLQTTNIYKLMSSTLFIITPPAPPPSITTTTTITTIIISGAKH